MKSNKFISLLAMAAVMASCSQEELVTVDNGAKVDLSARPVLGNVELGVAEATTRMDIKDGSAINVKFETGDQIGAAIIDKLNDDAETAPKTGYKYVSDAWKSDTWTYSKYVAGVKGANTKALYTQTLSDDDEDAAANSAKDWYTTVEYISSNYPYTRDANGIWKSPANLVEGNYFFYMPYDAAYLNRASLKAVLPQIQDCSDAVMKETTWQGTEKVNSSSTAIEQLYKGTTEGFEKAMAIVGYKFLEDPKDGSLISPDVELNTLYAYPLITIKNNFNSFVYANSNGKSSAAAKATKTITIDSIQIYHDDANSELFYTAPIKSATVATALATKGEWNGKKLAAGAPTADILNTAAAVANYPGHASVSTATTKLASAYTGADYKANHVTCVIGKELASGASYSFHAVLPAANYGQNLKARVFAQIDGKRVIITNAANTPHVANAGTAAAAIDYYNATTINKDYTFFDAVNGGMDCELVRGEQFPKAEIREDGKGIKAFAGTMLTINLKSSINTTTGVVTGATAFVLNDPTPQASDNGLMNNTEFVEYLVNYLQRGVTLQEVVTLRGVSKNSWRTYNLNGVTAAPGNIAFAENNEIVINAQLIKDLKNQTIVDEATDGVKLTLTKSNFAIANDVKIKSVTAVDATTDTYEFATLEATPTTYKINMTSGVAFGNDPEKLIAGINKVTTNNKTLKPKAATVANAVVMLNGVTATFNSASTGISAIYVPAGTTLNVNAACDALVIAEGTSTTSGGVTTYTYANIVMGTNGSLTNANNVYNIASITNTNVRPVAGNVAGTTKVTATPSVWPTAAIPANTQINTLVVNPANTNTVLAIDQAQIDMLANLAKKVTVTLGSNVASISSTANVDLNNVKAISAPASINWNTTASTTITVDAKGAAVTAIAAGSNVTITNVAE